MAAAESTHTCKKDTQVLFSVAKLALFGLLVVCEVAVICSEVINVSCFLKKFRHNVGETVLRKVQC